MKELKTKIENTFLKLIEYHQLTYGDDALEFDIYQMTKENGLIRVLFNDENMTYLLAGYVATTVYEEMIEGIESLGYTIDDVDGPTMYLKKVLHNQYGHSAADAERFTIEAILAPLWKTDAERV